ncbi:MFS transporter [Pseudanabaena sp. PCC 6802]|uniref:MFS transporter n=1 Tax=Pseudanabaena sp. PCC 6802 TaxID=118173 RepID=UPI00034B8431|nr:tetracycline resistance MFS efflux pump [Pseudanabaena sp. PCC 6802]
MNRTFWIIALISFINSLSLTILIPVIYLYGKQYQLSDFDTSLLFATYSIAQFFATPVIGKLSDRFGRKPLLIVSLFGTVVANAIAGFAPNAAILFMARFLDGITGGNNSVAQAVMSDVTTPANRTRAFGINGAAFGLGFVLGPAVSLLAQKISLGASFVVSGMVAAIALLLTIFYLPETLEQKPEQLSFRGAKAIDIFDLGLDSLIKGLAIPKIGILLIVNFLIGTTFTIFTFAFQPYFLNVLGQNNEALTMMFFIFGVLGVIMQTAGIPALNRRLNVTQILFMGLLIRSTTFVLMPVWQNIVYFVAVSIVFSLFNSLVQPAVNALISLNAKPEEQGIALGLNSSYLSISNAIGPVIAGALIDKNRPITYSYSLYLAGGLTFLVLLLAIFTRRQYAIADRSNN